MIISSNYNWVFIEWILPIVEAESQRQIDQMLTLLAAIGREGRHVVAWRKRA